MRVTFKKNIFRSFIYDFFAQIVHKSKCFALADVTILNIEDVP